METPLQEAETLDSLLAFLAEEKRKRKRRVRYSLCLLPVYIGVLFIAFRINQPVLFIAIFVMMLVGLTLKSEVEKKSEAQQYITRKLIEWDDVRVVGPLAEELASLEQDIRFAAERALISLLPRLRATDADLLNTDQRHCLYYALSGTRQIWLKIAILKALEQVGDSEAIPYVERLAAGEGAAEWSPEVRQAAIDCLPYLQERTRQESTRQTLLRSADLAGAAAETLLRSAGETQETDPQQLLRVPTGNEEG
ncbi:MAG TPA: hypothetical protein VFA07_11790 [Chthonomonadaceae bacterium]|nr:hypothetical protein [Chthonomonadaceae bacterium]